MELQRQHNTNGTNLVGLSAAETRILSERGYKRIKTVWTSCLPTGVRPFGVQNHKLFIAVVLVRVQINNEQATPDGLIGNVLAYHYC